MINYKNTIFPLSNFVLWTKNWYVWLNHDNTINKPKEQLLEEMRWLLAKDDYISSHFSLKDCAELILHKYQDYLEWRIYNRDKVCDTMRCMSLCDFVIKMTEIKRMRDHYLIDNHIELTPENQMTDAEAIIYAVRDAMMFVGKEAIKLSLPIYEKHGPVIGGLYRPGMTYKQMTKAAEKVFNIK